MSLDDRAKHADTIIRNHSVWSVASGAIPIALADLAAVSAVQLDMIRQLCEVYDVDFSVTRGKAMVTSITSAALARVGAASVVKMVPIAGSLVGSVTGGVLAGASSYALGQAFKAHLTTGGTFLDLDADRLKAIYREQFEKGKEVVKEWQAQPEDEASTGEAPKSKSRFRFENLIRKRRQQGPAKGKRNSEPAATPAPTPEASAMKTASADMGSLADKLAELTDLRDKGLISAEDYENTKRRLLQGL